MWFFYFLLPSRFSLHLWLSADWLEHAWMKCFSVYPTEDSLKFSDLRVNIFHQICQDFSQFFQFFFFPDQFFSSSPPETPSTHLWNTYFSTNLRLWSFCSRIFSLCSLYWLIYINLQWIIFNFSKSFVLSDLWSSSFSECFLHLLYFSTTELLSSVFEVSDFLRFTLCWVKGFLFMCVCVRHIYNSCFI